jgi:hypothetical protein
MKKIAADRNYRMFKRARVTDQKLGNIKMKAYMHAGAVLNGQQTPDENLMPTLKEMKEMGPAMKELGRKVFTLVKSNLGNIGTDAEAIKKAHAELKSLLGF